MVHANPLRRLLSKLIILPGSMFCRAKLPRRVLASVCPPPLLGDITIHQRPNHGHHSEAPRPVTRNNVNDLGLRRP